MIHVKSADYPLSVRKHEPCRDIHRAAFSISGTIMFYVNKMRNEQAAMNDSPKYQNQNNKPHPTPNSRRLFCFALSIGLKQLRTGSHEGKAFQFLGLLSFI